MNEWFDFLNQLEILMENEKVEIAKLTAAIAGILIVLRYLCRGKVMFILASVWILGQIWNWSVSEVESFYEKHTKKE